MGQIADNGEGVMNRDSQRWEDTISYNLPSLMRGLYSRVARKLRIDPSYVSRVARGERISTAISQALQAELRRVALLTNGKARGQANGNGRSAGKAKRKAAG
jgi:hypothetical protein